MRGNSHVRFLGEKGAAMPLTYPIECESVEQAPTNSKSKNNGFLIFMILKTYFVWAKIQFHLEKKENDIYNFMTFIHG